MNIKILPLKDFDDDDDKASTDLLVKSIREFGLKFFYSQAESLNCCGFLIFFHDKLIGNCSIRIKKTEGVSVHFLDNLYIKKKYRKIGIGGNVVSYFAKKYEFFGIDNPLRVSLIFWNKWQHKAFEAGEISSNYLISPISETTDNYFCICGESLVILEDQFPRVILKNNFSKSQLEKISNHSIPVPDSAREALLRLQKRYPASIKEINSFMDCFYLLFS